LAGGWLPEGRIVMTPQLCPDPFSVCLIMGFTDSETAKRFVVVEDSGFELLKLCADLWLLLT
jgi:hypothetical protein